jgi:hypothetical protein
MSIYIIKSNDNIVGVFNDLQLTIDYSYSISKALLTENIIKIYNYKQNSNILLEEIELDTKQDITKNIKRDYYKEIKDESEKKESLEESLEEIKKRNKEAKRYLHEQNVIGQELIDIKHKMNILKLEKEKITELQNIFDVDLELYNKLKGLDVPDLFKDKYELFQKLETKNILNFDSFVKYYSPNNVSTEYDSLFDSSDTEDVSDDKIREILS